MSVYPVNFFDIRAIPPPDSSLQNALVALTVVNVFLGSDKLLHKAPSLSLSLLHSGYVMEMEVNEGKICWEMSHGSGHTLQYLTGKLRNHGRARVRDLK